MLEVKETSPASELQHGHTVVGVTQSPLSTRSYKFARGIMIRTPGVNDPVPNVDIVYVGRRGVLANNSLGGGMPLLPGANLELPVDDPSQVYVISGTASQDVAWMGV